MRGDPASPTRAARIGPILLALVAIVPFLASDPGRVSADSRQYLYLDPGGFLSRAVSLWDPSVAAGTVPHQHLGFLWPMGPWFWLTDVLGVPVWIAQRLWLAGLAAAAGLGMLRLCRALGITRTAALVAALAYQLTPYQLAFTARFSTLLLPWAALPWLVLLALRATREGDWRAPAAFGLVAATAGSVNASSLVLVLVAPAAVFLDAAWRGPVRPALLGAARVAAATAGASAWWVAGLVVQGRYGLPVLQLTENVDTVGAASVPDDIVRGLGNWIFVSTDGARTTIDQAAAYADSPLVRLATIALPALALGVLIVVRSRARALLAGLVAAATVVGVGVAPLGNTSPYGEVWRRFSDSTSVGLALRNTPRVVPVIVLGVAVALGIGIDRLRGASRRAGVVAGLVLVVVAIAPVLRHGFLSDDFERPANVPEYWTQLAADLDASSSEGRVLELPGSNFAAYDWGNAVEPVLPGLTRRRTIAREVLPAGGAGTVDLLGALDRQFQQDRFEPASLAPVARLLGVSDVVVRGDLDRARFGLPEVRTLIGSMLREPPPGFNVTGTYGEARDGGPELLLLSLDETHPRLRADAATPVVLAGNGDGIVDAAAAGVVDGRRPVLEAVVADQPALDDALARGATLVLTDTNRKRATTFFYTIAHDVGATERADERAPDPTGYDVRYGPFATAPPAAQTVAVELGGRVETSLGGGPEHPEDRAANAFDGDPATAWRPGAAAVGQWVEVHLDRPLPVDDLRLLATSGTAAITRVGVIADGQRFDVALDERSRQDAGQALDLPVTTVRDLRVELTAVEGDGAPGLAEIDLGEPLVDEVLRVPHQLVDRLGEDLDNPVVVVLTRAQGDRSDPRPPVETDIDREVSLPGPATFHVSGDVGADSGAIPCTDALLEIDGRPVPVRVVPDPDGRGRLEGCGPVELAAGRHRITSTPGGALVDRIVLDGRDGDPPSGASRTRLVVSTERARHLQATATNAEHPFWIVLSESRSDGWSLDLDGGHVIATAMVDGYANGWLVQPDADVVHVDLSWTPQRLVWLGFGISGISVLLALFVLVRHRHERRAVVSDLVGARPPRPRHSGPWALAGASVALLASVWLVSEPAVVVVAAVALAARVRWPGSGLVLAAVAGGSLVAAEFLLRPALVFAGLAVVGAVTVVDGVRDQGDTDADSAAPG